MRHNFCLLRHCRWRSFVRTPASSFLSATMLTGKLHTDHSSSGSTASVYGTQADMHVAPPRHSSPDHQRSRSKPSHKTFGHGQYCRSLSSHPTHLFSMISRTSLSLSLACAIGIIRAHMPSLLHPSSPSMHDSSLRLISRSRITLSSITPTSYLLPSAHTSPHILHASSFPVSSLHHIEFPGVASCSATPPHNDIPRTQLISVSPLV